MASSRSDWALCGLLEALIGPIPDVIIGSQTSWTNRGMANWYRFNYYIARQDCRNELSTQMSLGQRESYRLLHEWWTAAYQDPAHSLAAILELVDGCEDLSWSIPGREEDGKKEWDVILTHLQLKRWPKGDIEAANSFQRPDRLDQHYDERLRWLFRCEFLFASNYEPLAETASNFSTRRNARLACARLAYCQELGYNLFIHGIPTSSSSAKSLPSHADDCSIQTLGSAHPFLTRGPVFEACPWLSNDMTDAWGGLPYYLWDVLHEKTVIVGALNVRPEYTAISHTWGRWPKDEGNPAKIAGTDWHIPQNMKFHVQELRRILKEVPCDTRYIWLDLVCIPQDRSAIASREIARQAKIFRSAKRVVAWLNGVDDFGGLHALVEWQALQLLRFQSEDDEQTRQRLAAAALHRSSGRTSGLLEPGCRMYEGEIRLNPWFTSLWTLQEAAMRPDMLLCTRNWELLSWGDGGPSSPIPLSGFIAIADSLFSDDFERTKAVLARGLPGESASNTALWEVSTWQYRSGMGKIVDLDRVALLSLGDRRECSGRRAEAIMSALGVTEWYEEALREAGGEREEGGGPLERDLVLGKYPLRFVNELSRKIPGEFFGATLRMNTELDRDRAAFESEHGSLLPFGRGHMYHADASVFRQRKIPSQTHPSLLTWHVLRSGETNVRDACIVSKSSSPGPGTIYANIIPFELKDWPAPEPRESACGVDLGDRHWVDLHRWMGSLAPDSFAVVTEFRHRLENNIKILQAVGLILENDQRSRLRKRFHFMIHDEFGAVDVSGSERVNWVIW